MRSRRRLDALIYGEIDRRLATGERGMDVLSLLLDAADEEGNSLERRHVRDEVMTLLFAGHDTTTSTVSFMFYELARNPEVLDDPGVTVEMIVDETLRKYPPAYIGPRRAIESFEFEGVTRPGRGARRVLLVGEPPPARTCGPSRTEFRPERFSEENKAKLPLRRLRAVRRRLAHVHRDALRPGGGRDDRARDPRALPARAAAGLRAATSATRRRSPRATGCRCVVRAAEPAAVLSAGERATA